MNIVSSLAHKVRGTKLVAGFLVLTSVATLSASAVASAAPSYFDVAKPSSQRICYKQFGTGWKAAGFKNLDHCLRYVSTPAPEDREDCRYGWWFVYGFNSFGQCAHWVKTHGGGYGGTI